MATINQPVFSNQRNRNQNNQSSNGSAIGDFAVNQQERWIAAEPMATVSGTSKEIKLIAKQGCWVDLSRLIIQAFPTTGMDTANVQNPFNQDLNAYTFIQQITVKGNQKMVQGTAKSGATTVQAPAGFFSPCRDITGWHLMSAGEWFRLNTQDVITIETLQTSGAAGLVCAAAPIVLDCDIGLSAYPAGFPAPGPRAWTGAQVVASSQSSATAIATNITLALTLNQAGLLNWNQLVVAGTYNAAAGTTLKNHGTTRLPFTSSFITSMTDFSSQEYVQGDPQTSGNALALPLACYMPAGSYADRAGYPWCRLPALQGSSGNAISLTINSKNTSTAWTTSSQSTRILSAAAPFYGSPVDPLSCD